MIIENTVNTLFPTESVLINKHIIEVIPYYTLNEIEVKNLCTAFLAIEKQLQNEKFDPSLVPKAQLFLTKDGCIEYKLEKGVMGNCVPYWVVFPIERWRTEKIQDNRLAIIMIEELCHWIWQEFDETKVKYKVVEVLQNIDGCPISNIDDIFDMSTVN